MERYVFLTLCLFLCSLKLQACDDTIDDDWEIVNKPPRPSTVNRSISEIHIVENYIPAEAKESIEGILDPISGNSDIERNLTNSQRGIPKSESISIDLLYDIAKSEKKVCDEQAKSSNENLKETSEHKNSEIESEKTQEKTSMLSQYVPFIPIAVALGILLLKTKTD